METIMLGITALFILIPIMYVLPMKISFKGKMSLLAIAFVLASIGLLANTQFLFWQVVLILVLLVVLATLILSRRFTEKDISSEKKDLFVYKVATSSINESEKTLFAELEPDFRTVETSLKEDQNEQIDNRLVEEKLERVENVEQESVPFHLEKEEIELVNEMTDEKEVLDEFDEDISFLANRNKIHNMEESTEEREYDESNDNKKVAGYMSEIEKLLEETEIEAEENKTYTQIEDLEEMDNLEEIVLRKNHVVTETAEDEASISDEEVEIEELVFQK